MSIGLYVLCPTTDKLLREQLEPSYRVRSFENSESLESAFKKTEVDVALWERDQAFHVRSAEESLDFSRPFSLQMMLQFVSNALLQLTYQIGPYRFDPHRRTLERRRMEGLKSISLREKESEILLYLLRTPGMRASRHDLLTSVWGIQPGMETRTLETHVYQLRQKIKKDLMAGEEETGLLLNTEEGYCLYKNIGPSES